MKQHPSGPGAGESMGSLLAAAGADSDAAFRRFLAEHKHCEDLPAPVGLRRLLLGRRTLRLELSLAYRREGARESLSWWLGEVGWPGRPEEVRDYLKQSLEGQGFRAEDSPEGLAFSASGRDLAQRVEVSGPLPWTGGRETACGIRLLWTAARPGRAAPLPLGGLLRELPALRDGRVDAELVEALSSLTVDAASIGGTWTRYYSWEAALLPAPGEDGASLRARLRGLLESAGYSAGDRLDDHEALVRSRTGSHALLYDPDRAGRVRLSLQPES